MITVSFNLAGTPRTAFVEEYAELIRALFASRPDIEQVAVSDLPGGNSGLSGYAVLVAQPYGHGRSEYNPLLVRIGARAALEEEQRRYHDFVEPIVGQNKASKRDIAVSAAGDLAAITYDYLRDGQEPLKTLREILARDRESESARQAVHALIVDVLARPDQHNGWYQDCRAFEAQRPLWYYNTVLPATLTLDALALEPGQHPSADLSEWIVRADGPEADTLLGVQVALAAGGRFSSLDVIGERQPSGDQEVLRLHLLEQDSQRGEGLYQPIVPLAARVDLRVPKGTMAELRGRLDGWTVVARVTGTRYGFLRERQARLRPLPKEDVDGTIRHETLVLSDPLPRYLALLGRPARLHTSMGHGDLNLGNILLRRDGAQGFSPWLIDFDKTGPGQHAVFDAVKLETEYKIHILSRHLRNVSEFLQLEMALYEALNEPDRRLRAISKNRKLSEAYAFIASLRRTVLYELNRGAISAQEYYLGLLGYGLAALKYNNLYPSESDRANRANVEPLATVAYLSASFAAAVADACAGVRIDERCFPLPISHAPGDGRQPWLIPRDAELINARQQLLPHDRSDGAPGVVLLYGAEGSGRHELADELRADLADYSYALFAWPSKLGHVRNVEQLVDDLRHFLRPQRVRSADALATTSVSKIGLQSRQLMLEGWLGQFVDLLEPSRQRKLLALQIDLEHAGDELRAFVAELCNRLRRTPVILIASGQIAALVDCAPIEVPLLTFADVQTIVRYEQLPLDETAIRHLHTISYGRPVWLRKAIGRARTDRIRYHCSFQEAVMLQTDWMADEAFEQAIGVIDANVRRLLEVEALLAKHTPDALDEAELIFRAAYEPALGVEAAATAIRMAQRDSVHSDNLWRGQLRARLFRALGEGSQARWLYLQIAAYFQQQRDFDTLAARAPHLYLAARYLALAEHWPEAVDLLLELASDRARVYTAHCPSILALARELSGFTNLTSVAAERELLDLAGDCAAYLGQYEEAIEWYQRLLGILPRDDAHYALLVARLLKVCAEYGDDEQGQQWSHDLLDLTAEDDPLHAIARGYEGLLWLEPTPARPADPFRAEGLLREAVELLRRSEGGWSDERPFFAQEYAMLHNDLGRAASLQGRHREAVDYLTHGRLWAREQRLSPAVLARLENGLGIVRYYTPRQPSDPKMARGLFESALRLRQRSGDLVGEVRSAQNLANVIADLAGSDEDWDRAEQLLTERMQIARRIQAGNRDMISINLIDLLVTRGKFEPARRAFAEVQLDQVRVEFVRIYLLINRAKLALWEGANAECTERLLALVPKIAVVQDDQQLLEWAQLALELHLRFGEPLHPMAGQWLKDLSAKLPSSLANDAELTYVRGLAALADADLETARNSFARSRLLWDSLKYHYRAALIMYWQSRAALADSQASEALDHCAAALVRLAPFGEIPATHMLHDLQRSLTTNL